MPVFPSRQPACGRARVTLGLRNSTFVLFTCLPPPLFCFRVVLLRVQSNIVLSGGSTLLAGLPDRIEADVRSHAPADVEINVMAAQERALFVFIGGSILASLPTFESQWISSEVGACVGWQFVVLICLLLSLINVRCCRRGCF